MKTWLTALAWLLGSAPLWSCGGQCEPCTTCPDLLGDYYGWIEELSDDCDNWDLVVGDILLQVTSQAESELQMQVTDNHGLWALFEGFLCQAEEAAYPLHYPFNLTYQSPQSGDETTDYLLSGYFAVESEGAGPVPYATLTISHFNTGSGTSCRLRGSITPRSELP